MSDPQVVKQTDHEPALLPAVEVLEDAQGITLYADLPGVPRDKLSIQVQAEELCIEGEMQLSEPAGMQSLHAEVSRPRFRRVFSLSKELDAEQVSAELKHGVLKLRIPKAAQAQPKKISVQVH